MSDPVGSLVSALESRMGQLASRAVSGLRAELGVITGAGLRLDSFPYEIPDYGVADWTVNVQLPVCSLIGTTTVPVDADGVELPGASSSQRTRFDFDETEVTEVRLNMQAALRPGDRVLAIPIDGGNQAVVVCKVVNANG